MWRSVIYWKMPHQEHDSCAENVYGGSFHLLDCVRFPQIMRVSMRLKLEASKAWGDSSPISHIHIFELTLHGLQEAGTRGAVNFAWSARRGQLAVSVKRRVQLYALAGRVHGLTFKLLQLGPLLQFDFGFEPQILNP